VGDDALAVLEVETGQGVRQGGQVQGYSRGHGGAHGDRADRPVLGGKCAAWCAALFRNRHFPRRIRV
jgi:hypothetical protein